MNDGRAKETKRGGRQERQSILVVMIRLATGGRERGKAIVCVCVYMCMCVCVMRGRGRGKEGRKEGKLGNKASAG